MGGKESMKGIPFGGRRKGGGRAGAGGGPGGGGGAVVDVERGGGEGRGLRAAFQVPGLGLRVEELGSRVL